MRTTDRSQLAVAIAVMLATLSLTPLTSDLSFIGSGWLLVIVLGGVSLLLRRLAVSEPVVLATQFVLLLLSLIVLSLGMVGSGGLVAKIVALFVDGAQHMQSEAAPMTPNDGVRLMLVTAVGVIAILTDLLVLGVHRPAWALAPLATLFLIPALGLSIDTGWFAFAAIAVGYLAILVSEGLNRTARWTRNLTTDSAEGHGLATPVVWRAAAWAAVPVTVLALILAPLLPSLSFSGLGIGTGSGSGGPLQLTDPTLDLRRNLRQQSTTEVVTYRTSSGQGEYLQLASLSSFSAKGWQNSKFDISDVNPMPAIPGRNDSGALQTATISVGNFGSQYLPLPYAPRSFTAAGDWGTDARSLVVVDKNDSTDNVRNSQYEVRYLDTTPTAAQLEASVAGSPQDVSTTSEVPSDLPQSLIKLSNQVTQGQTTDAGKAYAIQSWLRDTDRFTYDTRPAPGSGYQALERFLLQDRHGYCEQFAASMAMMARVNGIPSRVAVGFLPGEKRGDTFHIRLKDMHAWPELYFQGLGWVRYDPTPGVASGPSYVRSPDLGSTGDPSDTPTTETTTDTPSSAPSVSTAPSQAPVDTTTTTAAERPWLRPVGFSVGGLVLLVLLSLPATIRVRRRSARLDGVGAPVDQVEDAWAEVRDTVVDLGGRWPDGSPQTIGSTVSSRLDDQGASQMSQLATLVERSRYSAGLQAGDLPADLGSIAVGIRRGLQTDQSWHRKLLAVIAPRSLARSALARIRRR